MPDRTCIHCGSALAPEAHRNARYCSPACRNAKKYMERPRVPCRECDGPSGYMMSRPPAKPPICDDCKPEITCGTPGGHGVHRRIGERDCADCASAWSLYCVEVQRRSRIRGWRPRRTVYTLTCEYCREDFISEQKGQPFCSHRCHLRDRYPHSTEVVAYRPPAPPPHRLGIAPVVDLTPKKPRVWFSGPCSWCGEQFTLVHQSARFCSTLCSRRYTRSTRGDRFRPSPRQRLSIYQRDGWTCQLCFEPVDPLAHYSTDWAPSLDHIECQSWALLPDHSAVNLRTAHRWCNSIRGNESYNLGFFEEDFRAVSA